MKFTDYLLIGFIIVGVIIEFFVHNLADYFHYSIIFGLAAYGYAKFSGSKDHLKFLALLAVLALAFWPIMLILKFAVTHKIEPADFNQTIINLTNSIPQIAVGEIAAAIVTGFTGDNQ